jgi:hypothetical protein
MPLRHRPAHDLSHEGCLETGDAIGVHGVVECLPTSRNGSRSASAAPYTSSQLAWTYFQDCQLNKASGCIAPALISTSWLGGIAKGKL